MGDTASGGRVKRTGDTWTSQLQPARSQGPRTTAIGAPEALLDEK